MRDPMTSSVVTRAQSAIENLLDVQRPGWDEDSTLAARARALSAGFTEDRQRRETPALDAEGRHAYLAYFAPRTIAALSHVLNECGAPTTTTLDLGVGTGASSLVLALAGVPEIHLIERDGGALALAQSLISRAAPTTTLRPQHLTGLPRHGADNVLLSFSLSEFVSGDGENDQVLFDDLLRRAASRLIVVDGGDRSAARAVQHLRARALETGFFVDTPCPHADVCPALARGGDWCHRRTLRNLNDRFASFADRVGRDERAMSFSSLVVTRTPIEKPSDMLLVLAPPHVEKGRVRVTVCGANGVRTVQALRRHKDAANALKALSPGAVIVQSETPRGDTVHIEKAPVIVDAT